MFGVDTLIIIPPLALRLVNFFIIAFLALDFMFLYLPYETVSFNVYSLSILSSLK